MSWEAWGAGFVTICILGWVAIIGWAFLRANLDVHRERQTPAMERLDALGRVVKRVRGCD